MVLANSGLFTIACTMPECFEGEKEKGKQKNNKNL